MYIVGLTSHETGNHDSSAALIENGVVKNAIAEERISRVKHDTNFPSQAIGEILKLNKVKLRDINYFVSASPRINKLLFWLTYIKGFFYTDIRSILRWFMARAGVFFNQDTGNVKKSHVNSIYELVDSKKIKFVSHYLAHAFTAHVFSGFEKSLSVSWDGYGMESKGYPICGAVYIAEDNNFKKVEEIPVYCSLALYYGAVTVALGFKLNDGEGKTMGLAVYGKDSGAYKKLKGFLPYFNSSSGNWTPRSNWLEINGVSRPDYFRLTRSYRFLRTLVEDFGAEQVAYAVQKILEEEGSKYFKYLVKKYNIRKVSLAGGIFLNVKFNMVLLKSNIVDELFVYPNPSDGGVSVGAALCLYQEQGNKLQNFRLKSAYLGKSYSNLEIKKSLSEYRREIEFTKPKNLALVACNKIIDGKVLGLFEMADEWGPRALGARSVLADPRYLETKDRINDKLKQRDWFMPFAPVIMEEYYKDVLVDGMGTEFMTLTDNISEKYIKKIPAAIHIDGTARAQIISKGVNPLYWSIVDEFRKKTGIPVLLNTSFNKHGLPIVHTPKEAIEHLLWGCVDELIIGQYIVKRINSVKK